MAIKRPDIYEHNNPNLPIADSDFVKGGIRSAVQSLSDLYALTTKTSQLKQHSTQIYVSGENKFYVLKDINNVGNSNGWQELNFGGGATIENVVYTTGNQTISGVKNFASRPTFNGTGLLTFADTGNFNVTVTANLTGENLVYTTGNQTISGVKNFTTRPTFGGAGLATTGDLIGLEFEVSGLVEILDNGIVYTTGNQTISGTKNFVLRPTINGTGVLLQGEAAAGVVENVVYTTGNQTISGVKNFNQAIIAPEIRGSGVGGANRKIDLNLGQLYRTTTLISLDYINRILSGTWITNERLLVNNTGVLLSGEAIRSNNTITTMIKLTQAEYNALSPKDPATFYVILG
jgi:hypothetical protein